MTPGARKSGDGVFDGGAGVRRRVPAGSRPPQRGRRGSTRAALPRGRAEDVVFGGQSRLAWSWPRAPRHPAARGRLKRVQVESRSPPRWSFGPRASIPGAGCGPSGVSVCSGPASAVDAAPAVVEAALNEGCYALNAQGPIGSGTCDCALQRWRPPISARPPRPPGELGISRCQGADSISLPGTKKVISSKFFDLSCENY